MTVMPKVAHVDEEEALEMGARVLQSDPDPKVVWVLKVHAEIPPPEQPGVRIVTCERDPRDLLLSFRRFMKTSFEHALEASEQMVFFSKLYDHYPDDVLHKVRFEEIDRQPVALINGLAAFLGLTFSEQQAQAVAERFSRDNVKKMIDKTLGEEARVDRKVDGGTGFQSGHISGDVGRDWRSLMSEAEKKLVTARFQDWLTAHGYGLE